MIAYDTDTVLAASALKFLSGLLEDSSDSATATKNSALSNAQFEANLQNSRDTTAATLADPTKLQNWRQKQATVAAIMPTLRNAKVSAPSGMQGFMPSVSGGFTIPKGGFGADTLAFYTPEARAAAEGDYWKSVSSFVDPADLTKVGYGTAGQAATTAAQTARTNALAQQAINKANRASIASSGTSGGVGKNLASAAAGAALGAAANNAAGGNLSNVWNAIKGLFGGGTTLSENAPATSTGLGTPTINQGSLIDNNYGYLGSGADWGGSGTYDLTDMNANQNNWSPSAENPTTPSDIDLLYMTPDELTYYYGY